MNKDTIVMDSITQAMKGQEILRKYKIRSTIIKMTDIDGKSGCSYGLSIASADIERAKKILRKNGVMHAER